MAVTGLSTAHLAAARKTLDGAGPAAVETLQADVRRRDDVTRVVDATAARFGGLDILINNAGVGVFKEVAEMTGDEWQQVIDTNLSGVFHACRAAIPHMRNGDAIINTGSETGLYGSKFLLDYSMTKGGIHAFTKALAANMVPRGIRVNAVAPGPVWTPLNPSDKEAKQVAHFGEQTPMKRPAQPEELAPAYVFLASPQCSSYITGEILPVIGGYGSR